MSSNLKNQQYDLIEEQSIKSLSHPKFSTSTGELSMETLTAANKCPFHNSDESTFSTSELSTQIQSNQQFSSHTQSVHSSDHSSDSVTILDKIKQLFHNGLTNIHHNKTENLNYLRIPKTSDSKFPGIDSVIRLQKNGGVAQLHKHCDQLHKKHGPIYREKLGPVEGVFIADDELVKEVFKQEDANPTHMIPEPWIIYNEIKKVQRGLFFLNGESWKKQRTCLNGLFLKKGALSNYMGFFTNVIDDMIQGFEKKLDDNGSLVIPELEKQLYSWSIESLGSVIFGRRLGCIPEYLKMMRNPESNPEDEKVNFEKHYKVSKMQEEFNSAVRQIFIETGNLQLFPAKIAQKFNLPVWRRFVKANDTALEIAKNYVEENIRENDELKRNGVEREEGKGIGILNELLKHTDLKGAHLNNIITDLFLAATDTTSHSTQWALYLIAKNPGCQQKILEELDNVLEEGETLEEKHLKHLDYVRGVIKETLRLYPVAPFISRIFSKDINVGGYQIPKNKMVVFSLYTLGRMEKHYENADLFQPERWIRSDERKKVNSYAYIPFALGSRSCIGKKIAEAQMAFFISKMVKKFKIEMANENENIDIKLRMITTPENPISLKLTRR